MSTLVLHFYSAQAWIILMFLGVEHWWPEYPQAVERKLFLTATCTINDNVTVTYTYRPL